MSPAAASTNTAGQVPLLGPEQLTLGSCCSCAAPHVGQKQIKLTLQNVDASGIGDLHFFLHHSSGASACCKKNTLNHKESDRANLFGVTAWIRLLGFRFQMQSRGSLHGLDEERTTGRDELFYGLQLYGLSMPGCSRDPPPRSTHLPQSRDGRGWVAG
jgi:hypothetical protein